jgi:hypothetical protein
MQEVSGSIPLGSTIFQGDCKREQFKSGRIEGPQNDEALLTIVGPLREN